MQGLGGGGRSQEQRLWAWWLGPARHRWDKRMQVGWVWAVVGVSLYKPIFRGSGGLDSIASKNTPGFCVCA